MFEKRKAKRVYNSMVEDLIHYHEVMKHEDNYDGFDRGYAVIPQNKVSIKFSKELFALAAKNGFNISVHEAQHISNHQKIILFVIDNETEEHKAKKMAEIEEQFEKILNEDDINCPNVISFEEYKRRHGK